MKTTKWTIPFLTVAVSLSSMQSCQDWGEWDEDAGGQVVEIPEPEPSKPGYGNVPDPTFAEDNGRYYIYSTNTAVDGVEYQKGLVMRSTSDLFNFDGITDENAYVLSDVINEWAGEKLKSLDSNVSDESIIIGQPSLRKVSNEWRLYYSVSAGTDASIIGYAVADNAAGPWTDKGEVLSSKPGDSYVAYSPSFYTSKDGNQHFLAFGHGASGVFAVELNPSNGELSGSPAVIAKNNGGLKVSSPVVFVNGDYYVMFFTLVTWDGISRTYQVTSTSPTSGFTDINNRSAIFDNQWALTSVLSDYSLYKSDVTWRNTGGVDVIWNDNNNSFIVNTALANGAGEPELQIRRCFEVMDSRRKQSPEKPLMGISPEMYKGPVTLSVTMDDFIGDWHYGTQWAHIVNGMGDAMTFAADGTYSGGSNGTWDFNPGTNILHINSTSWNGEDAYLYCYAETDNINGGFTLVACGYNDIFSDYPGSWMKKDLPLGTTPTVKQREGVFAPTMAKENGLYYIISGNAECEGFEYQKGLVVTTTDDLSFFDPAGFILSDVAEGWAATKLRELDPGITEESVFTIEYPDLKKVNGKWRVYYSVSSSESKASVIGYGEADNLNGTWTDKGLVLASSSTDAYCAVSPSFCASSDNSSHYMAFGNNGIYVVELNVADSKPQGEPKLVINTTIETGYPELFYANGTYNLYYSVFNALFNQSAAQNPMGPYYSYGNRECLNISEWWTGRIFTPYYFESGLKWSGTNGGMSVYDDEGTLLVLHQAAIVDTEDYELHIREMNWLEYQRPDDVMVDWQKFPAICPERYTKGMGGHITKEELCAKPWSQFMLWRNLMNGCDSPYITLYEDGTTSLSKTEGEGDDMVVIPSTWEYDETTHQLHIYASVWSEHLYLYVYKTNNYDNADGKSVLCASGINHSFADRTGTWLKQATE